MNWLNRFLTSTIGRKVTMSITGLFLTLFLVEHLTGNLLLLAGDGGKLFNEYSEFMAAISNIPIRIVEVVLFLAIIAHVYTAILLTNQNKAAKGQQYVYNKQPNEVTWFSRYMIHSGVVILIFLLLHLAQFFAITRLGLNWPGIGEVGNDAYGNENAFAVVQTIFQDQWWFSVFYIIAFVLLAFHLNHGFQSAFKSLGLSHSKYFPVIAGLGEFISIILPAGFAMIPVYFLAQKFLDLS